MSDLSRYRRAECRNLKDCEYGPHVAGVGNGGIQDWHMEPDDTLQRIAEAWQRYKETQESVDLDKAMDLLDGLNDETKTGKAGRAKPVDNHWGRG